MSKDNAAAFPSKSLEPLEKSLGALARDVREQRVLMHEGILVDNLKTSAQMRFKSCRSSMAHETRKLKDKLTDLVQRCAAAQDTLDTDRVHARIHIHLCARTD